MEEARGEEARVEATVWRVGVPVAETGARVAEARAAVLRGANEREAADLQVHRRVRGVLTMREPPQKPGRRRGWQGRRRRARVPRAEFRCHIGHQTQELAHRRRLRCTAATAATEAAAAADATASTGTGTGTARRRRRPELAPRVSKGLARRVGSEVPRAAADEQAQRGLALIEASLPRVE